MQLFEINDGEKTHSCCCCWLYSKPFSLCKILVHLLIGALFILGVLLVIFFTLAKLASDGLVILDETCRHRVNFPSNFNTLNDCQTYADVDFSEFFTNDYENITFKSRLDSEVQQVNLKGWYLRNSSSAPVVVVSHGFDVCRNHFNTLLPSVILKKNGFNVVTYDLRNHGESEKPDGMCSWGIREHFDLLGAIDYARTVEGGRNDSQIALFGSSMGSRISTLAFSKEKNLAGLWIDSSVYNPRDTFEDGISNVGVTTAVAPAGWSLSESRIGLDLDQYNPEESYNFGNRKVHIAHSDDDNKAPIDQAEKYRLLAEQQGTQLTYWVVDTLQGAKRGSDCTEHVILGAFNLKEYERRIAQFFHSVFA